MGLKDLQLFKKPIGGRWEHVVLPEAELPPVDLGASSSPSRPIPTSPAPGRPCQSRADNRVGGGDKRSRESSGSPRGTNSKSARNEAAVESDNVDNFSKAVEEADLVADTSCVSPAGGLLKQPDVGMVMSISGTPSKTVQSGTSYVNSPVFSRLVKN